MHPGEIEVLLLRKKRGEYWGNIGHFCSIALFDRLTWVSGIAYRKFLAECIQAQSNSLPFLYSIKLSSGRISLISGRSASKSLCLTCVTYVRPWDQPFEGQKLWNTGTTQLYNRSQEFQEGKKNLDRNYLNHPWPGLLDNISQTPVSRVGFCLSPQLLGLRGVSGPCLKQWDPYHLE